MTIQQLQYVLEVSRTGSISKAARNLFLSQPNISNSIKNLKQGRKKKRLRFPVI